MSQDRNKPLSDPLRLRLRLRLALEIGQVESKPREQRGQQESSDYEKNHKTS